MDNKDNIVEIDLAKIDNDILNIKSQIEKLSTDLEMKETLRKYILMIAINSKPRVELKEPPKQQLGVSEFILKYLDSDGDKGTSDIIKAYAEYTGEDYNKISNNVSNALSRLKTANKINNEKIEGGRKAGSRWYSMAFLG